MTAKCSENSHHTPLRRSVASKLFCLLLLLIVCLPTGTAETPPKVSEGNAEFMDLTAGTTINRELTTGAKDAFGIWLSPGDLLRLSIDKGDLALSLTIYDPAHKKLLEQISYGFEPLNLSILSELAGQYVLEIHSLELSEPRRSYALKLEPIRPATPIDRRSDMAQRATASASFLRADWTEKALRQAVDKYDEAALIWHSLSNSQNAAIATLEAAEVLLVLGEYRESLQRSQKAAAQAKRAGAKVEQSRALAESGRLSSYLGDNDRAQKQVVESMKVLGFDSDPNQPVYVKHSYAKNLLDLGEVTYSRGNLLKSSKEFEEAIKVFDEIGDRTGSARAHLFLGYITGSLGDPERAIAELSHALRLYRAMKDKTGEGLCLTALGISQSVNRNELRAIKLHRDAIEIFRAIGDRQSEGIAVNGLGQANEFLKEYRASLEHYQNALGLFQASGNLDSASLSLLSIARVYGLIGDREEALAHYEKCLKLSRSAKKVRTEANALSEVAVLYAAQGDRDKTIRQYQKVLRFYASISDRRGQATAWNNLGDVYFGFGEKQEALRSYELALQLSEQAGDKAVLVSSLYNIARAQLDRGALESALDSIKKSIELIEDLRTNVSSPEFRISFFSGERKHYDLCMGVLMKLHQRHPDQGFDAEAFLTSENARARSLADILTEARAGSRVGVAPELLARERNLRGLLRAHAQYQMNLSISGKDPAEKEEVAQQLNLLRAQYQELEGQLRETNPPLTGFDQPTRLSLDQIQAELRDDNTILLEYALGDEGSYLWAVTEESLRSYELPPRSTLEDAGREVYKLLTARQEVAGNIAGDYQAKVEASDRSYDDRALKLSQLLLGPVADQLGTKRILIVTEGVLQYIPFDALPSPQSTLVQPAGSNLRPAITDTNEVVVLPSVSTLIAIRQQKRKVVSSDKVVAIFADPVFNKNDGRVRTGTDPEITPFGSDQNSIPVALRGSSRGGGPGRLVHSSEEADAIVATAPRGTTMVAKDFDANRETAMMPAVGDYQIVHFATHGFFNSEHPELSGIVLSMVKPGGGQVNGFMGLHDIYKLNLSAQLVVLSACDTALGKDVKGEGLLGLTRGFMYAGSRSVVTSLWKVDDRATSKLMKHFYEFMLRDGMTPSAALRSAKQKVREDDAWKAPFFWAGFTFHGEYKERIVTRKASSAREGLVVSLALVLISGGVFFLQRRRRARLLHRSA